MVVLRASSGSSLVRKALEFVDHGWRPAMRVDLVVLRPAVAQREQQRLPMILPTPLGRKK